MLLGEHSRPCAESVESIGQSDSVIPTTHILDGSRMVIAGGELHHGEPTAGALSSLDLAEYGGIADDEGEERKEKTDATARAGMFLLRDAARAGRMSVRQAEGYEEVGMIENIVAVVIGVPLFFVFFIIVAAIVMNVVAAYTQRGLDDDWWPYE